jgi:hypothetical protein
MLALMPNRTIRVLLSLLAGLALALGPAACGGAGKSTAPTANTAAHDANATPNFSTHNNDRDNDGDHNDDDEKVLYFGQAAGTADRRELIALVTRYFAAAATENGAAGCRMLVPFIAEGTAEQQGQAGSTCAFALSELFKQHHPLLAEKQATLRVIGVRVEGNRALAILDFPNIPEVRQIGERRVGNTWKMLDLLDGIIE